MQVEEESPKQYVDIARAPDSANPSSALRRAVYCVTLLDHIDIWPSSGALHTVRPGHNASRAYI